MCFEKCYGACYCTCSLGALRVPEMCFWPANTRKNLEILRCIHVLDLLLKYGSDINEGNWLQLLFHFIVLMGIVASVKRMSFFSAVFEGLDWSFLVLHFDINFWNWIPKVFWLRMHWFWDFFWKIASFVDFISLRTDICTNCSIVILFWPYQIFSMFSLRGILVCSLKMLVLLALGFRNIDWSALKM